MIYNAGQLVKKKIEKIEKNNEKRITGIPSGFANIDQITSGWQPSDFIIIGARPSMGKTAFALSMARNMAIDYNIPVAFFSLELSSEQIMERMISIETGFSNSKLRKGKLKQEELELMKNMTKPLSEAPIYIDETPSLSIIELEKKAFELVIHHDIKIIIIDYLQLITADENSKNKEEVLLIYRRLKTLARELNIPIIGLSQLFKEVDYRDNKRPILTDLSGSPYIEDNADIVSFLYRPEYYGLYKWDDDKEERAGGEAEFIILKNLRGSIDNIRLRFISRIGLFKNKSKNDRDWQPIKKK